MPSWLRAWWADSHPIVHWLFVLTPVVVMVLAAVGVVPWSLLFITAGAFVGVLYGVKLNSERRGR
jgi:Flp pilus assembly protein TadB